MGNEKYTQKVIEAFQTAQQIAALHYNQEISSVHMLMGLTKEPEGLLATIFTACKTDLPMLQARLEQLLKKIPSVKGQSQLSMSTEMVRVIGKAPAPTQDRPIPAEVYNIGCGHPVQLMDFIHTLEQALGKNAQLQMMPMQQGDVHTTYADTTKLERDFGYRPQVSLAEGIAIFAQWYEKQQTTGNND